MSIGMTLRGYNVACISTLGFIKLSDGDVDNVLVTHLILRELLSGINQPVGQEDPHMLELVRTCVRVIVEHCNGRHWRSIGMYSVYNDYLKRLSRAVN